jgi:hypothetical protein
MHVESGISYFEYWRCLSVLVKTSESIKMDWLSSSKMCFPGRAIEFSTLVTALSEWLLEAGLSRMKPSTKVPGGLSIGGDCGAWANLRLPGRRRCPVTFSIQADSEGESRG